MVILTHAGQQICMPVAVDHSNSIAQSGYCNGTKEIESGVKFTYPSWILKIHLGFGVIVETCS